MENKKLNSRTLKVIILIVIMLIIFLVIGYFYKKENDKNNGNVEIDTTSTELQVEYNSQELTGEWSSYNAKIALTDTKAIIEGTGVTSAGNEITIKSAGTYYITGSISDGNIVINAGKNDEVQLVLDNCSISSKSTAPINGIEASKLTITLADNSENVITDCEKYTKFTDIESSEPDGAIFTKTDLVINGNGKLIVNSNYSDGIVSKDELKIITSNIEINSEDDGIRGKDYVAINNSNIKIESKGDGIKSTNDTDSELGFISIEGGKIEINTEADGIQAETVLNIYSNAEINITTTGEIASSNNQQEFNMGFGGGFGGKDKGGYNNTNSTPKEDSKSSKGLKAGEEITIENGKIEINSTDDSIHSNGIVIINNGAITASSQDDGIHADTNIAINGGTIDVTKSYEGIESSYIEINGGTISIVASDDGINVAGGNDSSSIDGRMGQNNFNQVESSNRKLIINDGDITVNAVGDGLDANGSIYINGGSVLVAGSTSGGNGALDYDNECVVTGGSFIVYGAIGMWQNPSNNSTQYCLTFQTSGKTGDEIILKDSSGNEIASVKTEKTYGAITISNEKIEKGKTYTLYVNGSKAATLEANSIINSNVSQKGNQMQPQMKR